MILLFLELILFQMSFRLIRLANEQIVAQLFNSNDQKTLFSKGLKCCNKYKLVSRRIM